MLGTGIHMQVAVEGSTQTVFRKHAADGVFKYALGVFGENLLRGGLALAAGISGIALVDLVGHLLAGEDNLLGIDDDDIVAAIHMRGVARCGLAAQDVGHAGGQTTHGLVLGINEHPFLLDGVLVGGDCFVTSCVHTIF